MSAGERRFYHGVRFKLSLVALTLLAIPWAGYRYIQETEDFLRSAQETVLLGTAQAIATVLHNRHDLFGADIDLLMALEPQQALYAHPLKAPIQLDGYADDWQEYLDQAQGFGPDAGGDLRFDLLAGTYGGYLYLLLQVRDDRIVYRAANSRRLDLGDHIEIGLQSPDGRLRRYQMATLGPGWIDAYRMPENPGQPYPLKPEVRIKGEWQEVHGGYNLEFRIPEGLLGGRIALAVTDVDDPVGRQTRSRVRTSGTRRLEELGMLVTPSPAIQQVIDSLAHDSARIWVLDPNGRVLAQKGRLSREEDEVWSQPPDLFDALLQALYRLVLRGPSDRFSDARYASSRLQGPEVSAALGGRGAVTRRQTADQKAVILSAAYPIRAGGEVLGAVVVEQTTNAIVSIQNRVLEQLFLITLLLFAATSLVLLGFASRLAGRIRRLRDRVEDSVARDGRILTPLAPAREPDEIGDLGRSFSQVLARLAEYNRYLEAMASRLAHELRTPLTVVKSSLDALEADPAVDAAGPYLVRARQGAGRLETILHRMREATRLEQTLSQTERERFDLDGLLRLAVENYRSAYPDIAFELDLPPAPLAVHASPELISQALDKLVANAVDFHRPGTPIRVRLDRLGNHRLRLGLINQGPPLPEAMGRGLFDSMVSVRPHGNDEPHLGLGLYLVRLIAEFHGGRAGAENLDDGAGVEVFMDLPLAGSAVTLAATAGGERRARDGGR